MIGHLPQSLVVDGEEYDINSDFRTALVIIEAYNDETLTDYEKMLCCLKCLFKEIPPNADEALKQATWFLDGGDMPKSKQAPVKLMDWEYDQSIIFPAVNKVAGYETRTAEYLHWWSFLGLFNEIGEGLYSQVMNIRSKRAKHKKLEKWEREFYNEHKALVNIKEKLTAEEQEELGFINNLV
ncbi:MAG: hypothetical protein J1E85_09375 [Ruminococcus sp.]|nr:hypothetical protein [Ruminococcus sp.]